jgi:excisionase family DNA binding protein
MTIGSNTKSHLLTPDELAEYLKVSKITVYRLVETRQIPFLKVKGSLRFAECDVQKYLERNRIEPID